MLYPSDSKVKELRKMYPAGTRIKLLNMTGEPRMLPGLIGIVRHVDDIGTIQMSWANGSSLGLIPDEDSFEKMEDKENDVRRV